MTMVSVAGPIDDTFGFRRELVVACGCHKRGYRKWVSELAERGGLLQFEDEIFAIVEEAVVKVVKVVNRDFLRVCICRGSVARLVAKCERQRCIVAVG